MFKDSGLKELGGSGHPGVGIRGSDNLISAFRLFRVLNFRFSGTDPRLTMSDLSFTAFVISLATSAAVHLGDMPNPDSGAQNEPNLEGAAQMIEILGLLEQKTKGNLTAEERQVLEQVLYELRLRFVEVSGGGKRIIEP
jgi:hypothetical protein